MTKLMTTLTISAIASILIIGGFVASPYAYSSLNDIDDDDCSNDNDSSSHDNDGSHHDDCENEHSDDPCDCEKPDTLKFAVSTPTSQVNNEFKIEIFKKISDINNSDKKLTEIKDVINGESFVLESSSFGKDKLNSNTVFVIYNVTSGVNVQVASMEIHTSCSKPLYKGLIVSNNGYSLEVTDGLKKDKTSIPEFDPLICEDETKPQKIGSIIVRKALTNDNGGDAAVTDFTIKLTDVDTNDEFILVHNQDDSVDPSVNVNEIPVGTYKLSETIADTVTSTYTTVLIAGDSNCPAILEEPFTIKKGKTLSCTIYNDDNGNGNDGEIKPGVVFHFDSLRFDSDSLFDDTSLDPALDKCDSTESVLPCIINSPTTSLINVIPNVPIGQLRVTTLVQLNIIPLAADNTMLDPIGTTGCSLEGLGTSPMGQPSFAFQCNSLFSEENQFRVNYALIETLQAGKTLT